MGIAYSSVAGVGALGTWPKLGTIALLNLFKRLAAYRETSIPGVAARAFVRYVKYDASGSSSGGGGDGLTTATAWKVDSMASFKTLLAATIVANLGIAVRNGDKIYASAANTDQSLVFNQANCTIGAYSDPAAPSNERAAIAGYRPAGTPSIVGTVATFTTGALRAHWVRGKSTSGTYLMYRDQPYKRKASLSAFNTDNESYSYYDNGTDTVKVNFGLHDPATLQFSVAISNGVQCTNVDGCAVEDLDISGFGCNAMGTANGGQCVRTEVEDLNEFCCRRCTITDAGYHVTAQIVSLSTHGGGITSWLDIQWGYFGWDGSGNGDANVCYSYEGGQEVVRRNCWCRWGGLPADGQNAVRGQKPYAHTFGGARYLGLVLNLYNNNVPEVGTLLTLNDGIDVPVPSDNRLTAQHRVFVHGERTFSRDGFHSGPGWGGFRSNCIYVSEWNVPGGAFVNPTGVNANSIYRGVQVNTEFRATMLAGTWTSKQITLFFANAAHDHDFVHPRFRFTGAAPANGVHFQYSPHLANCAMWNPVVSDETGSTNSQDSIDYPETDPAVAAGGMAAPAVFGFLSTQYDGSPGYVTLGAAADYDRSNIPASLIDSSRALPSDLECEYDIFEQRRNTDHTKRTRGPIEARPIAVPHRSIGTGIGAAPTGFVGCGG